MSPRKSKKPAKPLPRWRCRLRRVRKVVLWMLLALGVLYFKTLVYSVKQGIGQARILINAVPVEEYLADPTVPDSLKTRVLLVQEIRQYAFDSLGLTRNDNYSTVYDHGFAPLMYVVTANEPYSLEPYEWSFPFFGGFPYKGYFGYPRAKKEYDRRKAEGLDVGIRTTTAWSTLGWFSDPILTGMLDRGEGELADLIIHELTHGTLFVPDSVEFNENLANFVGHEGALRFLADRFGVDSPEYEGYLARRADREHYVSHILGGLAQLEDYYASLDESMAEAEKAAGKLSLQREIILSLDTVSFSDPERYRFSPLAIGRVNNTFFASFARYESQQGNFDRVLAEDYDGDLRAYVADWARRYPSR